ncbi:hypothetical protein LTR70_010238 [Exophiala xenobiotica]|uniref:Alpha/beta hydrolase fold-3 domain-containing protein n=1 Tax=Lithohypha guttulata TaxID=1690604 RepID=A0ABR0JUL5_9EURO|nr:hypothetical protein LTR24_010222 [Lithohypha guttulata]KAK5309490.1 hypothetical protein LTR70_010238 [Exophiala xenobiotica]
METIAESILQRMPGDLRQYLEKQTNLDDIPICEQEPANVASEVIHVGHSRIKVYFPEFSPAKMVVFLHFRGDSGSIHIAVDYPSALVTRFRQILTDCSAIVEYVRQRCMGQWKETWNTDPARIILSGSSAGATLAILIAAIMARNHELLYGVIALVPLIDTNPDLAASPWGENENTIGLTPRRLLEDLDAAFRDEDPEFRLHWHSNPRKMPDYVMNQLPTVIMVLAKLDILYPSQVEFKTRLEDQGVNLSWIEVDGLHQVKDMDRVTAAGREVRQYILRASREFMKRAACSTDRRPELVPESQREAATKRLSPYDVRRLEEL